MLLHEAAEVIRKTCNQCKDWKFTGSFENNIPMALKPFMKWLLVGAAADNLTSIMREDINTAVNVLSQQVIANYHTDRATQPASEGSRQHTKERGLCKHEKPLTIGLGMSVYAKTRSKTLIEVLSDLNITCTYRKVKQINKCIYKHCCDNNVDEHGVYIIDHILQ